MEESKASPETSNPATAQLFIQFIKNPRSAQLKNNALIEQTFAADQPCLPIFVTGSMGKKSLLRGLAHQASFKCKEGDPDGVYLWPHPVELDETSVLFFKLRSNDNPADLKLRRKVKAAFMALSSVWIICQSDLTEMKDALKSFFDDYKKMRRVSCVELSKVYVCAYEDWFEDEDEAEYRNQVTEEYGDFVEILKRGEKDSPEDAEVLAHLRVQLGREGLHEPYLRRNVGQKEYIAFLKPLIQIASLDIEFEQFMQKIPALNVPTVNLEEHFLKIKQSADRAAKIKSEGRALNFTSSEYQKSSRPLISILQENYDMKKSAVVMSILGPPGCGKSTLLNYIIQYCTDAPELLEIFKMGNTGNHTTIGSEVFSHPLSLSHPSHGDYQLMLIDLEGLGGTETQESERKKKQDNLIMSIMTITSVLVIIITNEVESLNNTEQFITTFAKKNKEFRVSADTIILLFKDKEKTAETNPQFSERVANWNSDLFLGKTVVTMLPKPHFKKDGGVAARNEFLQTFLGKCACLKKYETNRLEITLQGLLNELCLRIEHDCTAPTSTESQFCDEFIGAALRELSKLYSSVKSVNQVSLVQCFENALDTQFYPNIRAALKDYGPQTSHRCDDAIESEVKNLKCRLAHLESLYRMIVTYPTDYMKTVISDFLKYQRSVAFTIGEYTSTIEDLFLKIYDLERRFPDRMYKFAHFVETIQITGAKLSRRTFQETVLLPVFRVKSSVQQPLKISNAEEQLHAFCNPRAKHRAAEGVCKSAFVCKSATDLFVLKPQPVLNQEFINFVADRQNYAAPLLLVIGSPEKSTIFANCFVDHISPLTPPEHLPFKISSDCEVLCFEYFKERSQCFAYILCLRMRKDEAASDRLTIAETLIPAASLTCVVLDRPNPIVEELLEHLNQPLPRLGGRCLGQLLLWHSDGSIHEETTQLAERVSIPCQVKLVEDFTKKTLSVRMEEVKTAFDAAPIQDARVLLTHILELSSVIAPSDR